MPKWNLPVRPEELQFALQVGNAAGTNQTPMDNPSDSPVDRFRAAIAQEFGNDISRFYSIMNRTAALMRLSSEDERTLQYLTTSADNSEGVMINDALIKVMARFPISQEGEFDEDAFFKEVNGLVENGKDQSET